MKGALKRKWNHRWQIACGLIPFCALLALALWQREWFEQPRFSAFQLALGVLMTWYVVVKPIMLRHNITGE